MGVGIILFVAVITALITLASEWLSWYLVYRTYAYTDAAKYYNKLRAKEAAKGGDESVTTEALSKPLAGPRTKKAGADESERLENAKRAVDKHLLKVTLIQGVAMFLGYAALGWIIDEANPVLVLPFVPTGLVLSLAQRGLSEEYTTTPTLASASFAYILCSMSIRPIAKRWYKDFIYSPLHEAELKPPKPQP